MQYSIITAVSLAAFAIAEPSVPAPEILAGGSQSAPGPSEYPVPVPTYGTIVTDSTGSYVAPLPPTPISTPLTNPLLPPVISTPLTHPLLNSTGYPTGTGIGGGPSSGPSASGNLSTTYGSQASSGAGGSGTASLSSGAVVTLTTTGEGGQAVTQTSVVGVAPSETGGSGGSANPTGETQPGEGSSLRAGSAAALAVLVGAGAMLL